MLQHVRSDIIEYFDGDETKLNGLAADELLDAFLEWNGICGFTTSILEAWNSIQVDRTIETAQSLISANSWAALDALLVKHGTQGDETLARMVAALRDKAYGELRKLT